MKISEIKVLPVEIQRAGADTNGRKSPSTITNVFIKVETDEGVAGYGCAAPDYAISGETPHSVQVVFDGIISQMAAGHDPLRISHVLEKLIPHLQSAPTALAAFDMALHDLMGKAAGLPTWKLLGGFRDRIKTSVTIEVLSLEETLDEARRWVQMGFKCLKIKGGQDVESDIERVLKLREAVGPELELRFDANQRFTVEDTLRFVEATRPAKLELLEQPTPKGQPELLEEVTRRVHLPVMAEESLLNLRDAFRLARSELVDLVDIKLMKLGGIYLASQINSVARSAGMEVLVGCLREAALGIAAGLHFALSRPNVTYANLDSHLDLLDDPSIGAVFVKNGFLYPAIDPGLGVDLSHLFH